MKTTLQRFWTKVRVTDTCWLWTASWDRDGYGHLWVDGKLRPAHRIAWELFYGTIPLHTMVCHTCDVPACVRPSHLFLGSASENSIDSVQKGRHGSHTHPERWQRGATHSHAKLNEQQVAEIKGMLLQGISQNRIAEQYGVSQGTITNINRGKVWRHVYPLRYEV